jgi:putative membrane protein
MTGSKLFRSLLVKQAQVPQANGLTLPTSNLPAIEAVLNGITVILLSYGYLMIRRKQIFAHKCCMLSAFGVSIAFLTLYLWFHSHYGDIHFAGHGGIRVFYLSLLATHIVLAAAIVPLALVTLSLALRRLYQRHKRIAHWTLPIWLYVSITGVVVYLMLYHLYPPQ